ncbi:MAG: peptidyl-prolyl cis-trans isomerase [Verrucomicrobiae bacterium]|nr:peptidyl-prolyl cis-trans isomerase [Verrucomicrobiae bacterium]MCX7722869.1 peptidyl-prolyl cis-trans isomerase [Verrucomicrobiae bacterium]MDW7980162.1 peptidyl-prolyl cis-trans isomerase [Verrucomicrobiales bacterium]
MIGTIRKHQKWLWLVLVPIVIITFVLYFSPYQRAPEFGDATELGTLAGRRITQREFHQALKEVRLRYLFTHGEWPGKDRLAQQLGYDEERETFHRLVLLHKLQELEVNVSPEAVARVAREVLRSYRRGAAATLDAFEREVLRQGGMTREDFQRFLRNELAIQQLANLAGLVGSLVTPDEAKALYRYENEEVTVALALFPFTNYLDRVQVSVDEARQFYSNHLARYEIPERVQLRYVRWDLTNFLSDADAELASLTNAAALVRFGLIPDAPQATLRFTNLDAVIEAIYQQRGTNFYSDAASPQEAKQQIREELRHAAALRAARKKAVEFASALFDLEPLRAANLDKLAAESNLTVRVTTPFDRRNPPAGLDVGEAFLTAAFNLTDDNPFTEPVVAADGVYVLALDKRFPPEIPAFEAVRERVIDDLRYQRALALAHEHGAEFHKTLTNGMAQGKTFAAICTSAGVKLVFPQPFSRRTRALPEVENLVPLLLLKDTALKTGVGNVSEFVPTPTGGFIVHVQDRLPVDVKRMEAELPEFIAMLRRSGQDEAFNMWLRAQAQQLLRNTPLARRAPDAGATSSSAR